MTNTSTRIAAATLGSVAVIGGLIGAKALQAGPEQGASGPATVLTPAPTASSHGSPGRGHGTAAAGSSATPSPGPSVTPPAAPGGGKDGTYTGDAANTRYGPVQVQIDVSSGRIDDIRVIQYPDQDPRDRQINQRAIPVLVSAGLAAQSADVDTVSGATYTSEGYKKSLQSAIDRAGI